MRKCLRISVPSSVCDGLILGTVLSHDELEQLPCLSRLTVRILLKVPSPGLPFFVLKRFPELNGIFWSVVVVFLLKVSFFFIFWLFSLPSSGSGFPVNIMVALGLSIPVLIFVFFLRMQLEREIRWWRNIHEQQKEWKPSKRVEELMELFGEQRMGYGREQHSS